MRLPGLAVILITCLSPSVWAMTAGGSFGASSTAYTDNVYYSLGARGALSDIGSVFEGSVSGIGQVTLDGSGGKGYFINVELPEAQVATSRRLGPVQAH